jgi:hypothetical protein
VGGEFMVNTDVANSQSYPAVALDGDGDFVIAWQSSREGGTVTRAFARRFAASGTPVGAELEVDAEAGDQLRPAATVDLRGSLVIAWESARDSGTIGVVARRFPSRPGPPSATLRVNSYVTDVQYGAVIAADDDGDFVVVWTSANQDGSGYGVFGRRFDAPAPE